MGRLVFAVTLVMAVVGAVTGFFYDLYTPVYLSSLIIVSTLLSLFALYVAAFTDDWNTYVPIALFIAIGVSLLDTTTGFPFGGVSYDPSFLSATRNTSLVFIAASGLAAMGTWRISNTLFEGWSRLIASTVFFAVLSVMASKTGVLLDVWSGFTLFGLGATLTQIIGASFTGVLHAVNGDIHEPDIPLFAEHVLSAFLGFISGVSVTTANLVLLILAQLAIILHLVNVYAR